MTTYRFPRDTWCTLWPFYRIHTTRWDRIRSWFQPRWWDQEVVMRWASSGWRGGA